MNKLRILFLCTGNSCRSQMAEGWARALKRDDVEASSAGVLATRLDPNAIKVMAECGVDISGQHSKTLEELSSLSFDYVVTLCGHAAENCPWFPGTAQRIHRGFDDPPSLAATAETPEEALEHYRRVRDEIRGFISQLPHSLASDWKK